MTRINPDALSWNRLGMTEADWRALANAFYALAHSSRKEFDALPEELREHSIGQLCARYLESGDHALIEEAGYALTGTRQWYVYLGR